MGFNFYPSSYQHFVSGHFFSGKFRLDFIFSMLILSRRIYHIHYIIVREMADDISYPSTETWNKGSLLCRNNDNYYDIILVLLFRSDNNILSLRSDAQY